MVYEGTLNELSDGKEIQADPNKGYWTSNMGITRFHRAHVPQEGFILRDYIDVGGTRIRNVSARPDYDAFLKEAIGQEVTVSILGGAPDSSKRHTVIALRTPRAGLLRPRTWQLALAAVVAVFRSWIAAVVGAFFVFFGIWLVLGVLLRIIFSTGALVSAIIGAVAALVWLLYFASRPFIWFFETARAARAIDEGPAGMAMLGDS
jgi:hypothetical protein